MGRNKQSGFTLIEVLVVMTIIGLLAVMGVQRLRKADNLKTVIRHLSTVLKKTRAYSKLNGKTYRLVLKTDPKEADSYWVESSSQMHLINPKASEEDKYKLSMDKEKESNSSDFQTAKDILNNPKILPKEWSFGKIESTGHPESQESDIAYIYFFPQGVSEEATIQITNKAKIVWTIHLNPLISKPELFEEAKVLRDFRK